MISCSRAGSSAPVGSNVSDVAPARAEASFADAPLLGAAARRRRRRGGRRAGTARARRSLGVRGTPRALDALASTGSCVAPSDGATASAVASSSFASSSFASCAAPAHPADPAPPARFAEDLTPARRSRRRWRRPSSPWRSGRARAPASDALTHYAHLGASEAASASGVPRGDPRETLLAYAAAVLSALGVYAVCVAVARHLRRAKYLERIRAFRAEPRRGSRGSARASSPPRGRFFKRGRRLFDALASRPP